LSNGQKKAAAILSAGTIKEQTMRRVQGRLVRGLPGEKKMHIPAGL